ncbi:MAG: hypothetical protein IH841_00710, partial [Thaumarchaeota archaeon]|nr:hypothetical protein [Nitrososphaerota archaeon]
MTKTILSILFVAAILMTAAIASSIDLVQFAEGIKSKGKDTPGRIAIKSYGSANKKIVCGDRLCSETAGVTKMPSPPEEVTEEAMEEKMKPTMEKVAHKWKTASETIKSTQDPGIGHESHQISIILPPTDKIYKGILSYDASEPIQLIALHGPLAEGEDSGQAIWTPDGKTKFALTFIDPETSMGSWLFTGNALAVHTKNTEQFTVSYSVSYLEKEMSDTVSTATMESVQDPGIGHEAHSIVIILPPSEMTYSGMLTYSASEPIQLIALHGPLAEGE